MTFKSALDQKFEKSKNNYFGKENFDEERFGKYMPGFIENIKYSIKKVVRYQSTLINKPQIFNYEEDLEFIYSRLNDQSRDLLVDIIAYRILGYRKIKLPLNNRFYWDSIEKVKSLKKENDEIDPHFLHFKLERFDLRALGYDLELYFTPLAIVTDFIIEQYAYKSNGKYLLQAEKGDTVLDIGACWGDTALYFASKVGEKGKVFSFEFIPGNIEIYKINIGINPQFKELTTLVEHPVTDISDQTIYFADNGPGSHIQSAAFENQTGSALTISIDDFVQRNSIEKVDFIKMDIEGAEPAALRGGLNTIKKHKPKLAIAIYHSIEDFVNIPKWLMALNLGYEFYLGHHTIHSEETVIYARSI